MGGTLLFLGYTLADWDFLVLFRLFANRLRDSGNTHIAVQLEPSDAPGRPIQTAQNAINYLNSYFGNAKIRSTGGPASSSATICGCIGKRSNGHDRFALCWAAAL